MASSRPPLLAALIGLVRGGVRGARPRSAGVVSDEVQASRLAFDRPNRVARPRSARSRCLARPARSVPAPSTCSSASASGFGSRPSAPIRTRRRSRRSPARPARASPRSAIRRPIAELKDALSGIGIAAGAGESGADRSGAMRPADWVIGAITGAAGLEPTLGGGRSRRHRRARQQGNAGLRRRRCSCGVPPQRARRCCRSIPNTTRCSRR